MVNILPRLIILTKLLALSTTSGGVSIDSIATFFGLPFEITSADFSFVFSISNGIAKKVFKSNQKKSMIKLF